MFENDYFERMIKTVINGLVSIFKNKNSIESSIENDSVILKEDQLLEIMIKKYISEGQINKAEDMLFEAIEDRKSSRNLELAVFFYETISKWDDEKLNKCNFSKAEIVDGLNEVKSLYNDEIEND
ncbi:DUF6483 family protein [Clostridium sp. UBA1652]|uniref:DUF6483 family protein n=1 Tax=Clostridium sp. UBA1652 TaxID=1946348 RepID=UPI00257E4E02|nr:DUF6483 family protein [Clostridium sp. UBA1652]